MSGAAPATQPGTAGSFSPDLAAIRRLSAVLPGALPAAINGVRVAAGIRPRNGLLTLGRNT